MKTVRDPSPSMKRRVRQGFSHHWTNKALTTALVYALEWAAEEMRRRDAEALAARFETAAEIVQEGHPDG